MRGVSANSWATKIEYIPSSRKREVSYSPIREWHNQRPGVRAKTSPSILGRRRIEANHKTMTSNIVLRGKGINNKLDKPDRHLDIDGLDCVEKRHEAEPGEFRETFKRLYYGRVPPKRDGRPKTSLGFGSSVQSNSNNTERAIEDLVKVYSFRTEGKRLEMTRISPEKAPDHDIAKSFQAGGETDWVTIKRDNKPPKRVMSVPLALQPIDNSNESASRMQPVSSASIWRSKQATQSTHAWDDTRPESRFLVGRVLERAFPRKPALRRLLDDHKSVQHSRECPYRCRNCFRACLVSDKYVRSASSTDTLE